MDFKYERLPNFCFACGRIGHPLKECDKVEDKDDGRYQDLDAKDQSYGPWLRASPLPKQVLDFKCESSSGTCSRNLFISTSNSKCRNSEREKKDEEEVNQAVKGVEMVVEKTRIEIKNLVVNKEQNIKDIEGVVESLGTVAISTTFDVGVKGTNQKSVSGGTWTQQKKPRKAKNQDGGKGKKESGKRQLVEVVISEGNIEDIRGGEKKFKGDVVMEDQSNKNEEVVLVDQHRLQQ